MPPVPEVHHHAHRTGHRWVDFAVPLSVQANSWPLLQFTTGNANDKGEPEITLNVENAGVGPATTS